MSFIGDYPEDFTTVCVYFTTHDGNGAPIAPLTAFEAADVSIYKNGSNAQKTSTNGVTMSSPFDSIVGLHCVVIDTSNDTGDSGFWTTGGGGVYTVILNPDTETVNGQVALKVLATFGICLSPALRPTTAGRTLVVDAAGLADANTVKVGPTGSGTAQTARDIGASVITASGTVTTVTNQLTAAQIATGVWQDATAGDFTTSGSIGKSLFTSGVLPGASGGLFIAGTNAATTITTALTTTFTGNLTGNVGGNVTGSVASVVGAVGSVTGLTASNLDATISSRLASGSYTAPSNLTAAQIATGVWQDATAGDFTAANSVGKSVMNGVSLGTGLTVNAVTGLTASNLDATISSRASQTSVNTIAGYLDTEIGDIKTKTDSLTFTVAGKLDVNILYVNGVAVTGAGTAGNPWGPL